MPFDLLRWLVQFAHVLSGVLWFGAGFYVALVQLPALMSVPPAQRGPLLAELAPRQIRYTLRLAEATIALGILNAFLTGRLARLPETLGSLWGWSIGVGFVLAIALYVLIQAGVRPAVFRMLAIGRQVQQGDASAAAQLPMLLRRVRRLGYAQMAIGALIVLLMVTARFT